MANDLNTYLLRVPYDLDNIIRSQISLNSCKMSFEYFPMKTLSAKDRINQILGPPIIFLCVEPLSLILFIFYDTLPLTNLNPTPKKKKTQKDSILLNFPISLGFRTKSSYYNLKPPHQPLYIDWLLVTSWHLIL